MVAIQKNDFIEIEFTGTANGNTFDTTDKEEAKKMGIVSSENINPLVISVGNQMLLRGFDESLESKEIGKEYSIHLMPENAFGKRNPSLVKLIPIKVFHEKNLNPIPGMVFQLDNYLVKVLSVSGGRVTVDFNNPLAGKEIDYKFRIKRKIEDDKEKINALQDFFFKQRFDFEIEKNNKKVIFRKSEINPFIEMFKDRFKTMTGFDFEVREEEKKDKEEK